MGPVVPGPKVRALSDCPGGSSASHVEILDYSHILDFHTLYMRFILQQMLNVSPKYPRLA